MTGRKLDKKAGRQLDKRRNWNKSHVGTTTEPKGIQPSTAFFWSVSESGRGDNQGLEETDKGVSNPNLNHPPLFKFPFQPSFSTSGAERPETKPVVKQTPVTSGFTFPFLSPSTFQPFSPPRAERPEKYPEAQESSCPSLFTFHQPRQTARTTDFVFGTTHTEQGGTETTERPGDMKTDTPQNTGNKEGKEHGDQEKPSAASSGGGGHRGNSNTEGNAHGGGRATDGSTDARDREAKSCRNTAKNNETSGNRLSGHTGLDSESRKPLSAQPGVESHPEQGTRQFGQSTQGQSRQGIRPPNTPATPRAFGRGRGRGHANTPDSGIASPNVGGQSSPIIREIHTMLSSVLEGQPDRGARRQLFADESAAGVHDYFSEIHKKYAAFQQLEQQTQQLRGELAKLEGELREKDKVIGQLQADGEGTRRSAEQERAALQSQLAERDGVITNLKRQMDHLNENMQSLQIELKTREYHAGSLATIGNMLAIERSKTEQLEREKAELADDIKQLREENRSMQGCLEEHDRTVSSLKLQKLLWKAVVSKQNSSLGECRTWQQQLVAELEKERQVRSALETDVAKFLRDVSQSQATLREQLDSFARERDDLNSQVAGLTSQLARAQEQAESYRTTAEEQTVAVCQLSEMRSDLEAVIATMQERAEVAEKKATRHEQEVNTLTLCRDTLQTQKTVAEDDISTEDAALRKAYTREEQLRSRISEQEDQKRHYLQEKEQACRQVKLLKDEVERLRRRCQGGDQNQI